jgi:TRAP-type C4-dicarboxylate transport system substrate-binding protein
VKHARLIPALAALAALLALPAAPRAAEPVTLKFAFPASLQSDFARIILAWVDDVNKAEKGAVKIQMFPGATVAKFSNVLDRVQNGVVDIGFGIFGPYSRQVPQTFVVELPFVTENSTECSTAMWRLAVQGVTAAEYKGFHPLALFCFTGASLQSTRPVRTADDMKGLKIAASGKVMADDLKLMGAAPITINPGDFFESLNRGLAQGVLISWPGAMSFKLQDVAHYHMSTPFGLFPAFVAMNKGSYARLSGPAKAAIDKLSGEVFSKRIGVGLDKSNDDAIADFKKMKGHEVVKLSDAELEKWDKILAPVTAEWVKDTPDGGHVLSAFKAELKKIRSGS